MGPAIAARHQEKREMETQENLNDYGMVYEYNKYTDNVVRNLLHNSISNINYLLTYPRSKVIYRESRNELTDKKTM